MRVTHTQTYQPPPPTYGTEGKIEAVGSGSFFSTWSQRESATPISLFFIYFFIIIITHWLCSYGDACGRCTWHRVIARALVCVCVFVSKKVNDDGDRNWHSWRWLATRVTAVWEIGILLLLRRIDWIIVFFPIAAHYTLHNCIQVIRQMYYYGRLPRMERILILYPSSAKSYWSFCYCCCWCISHRRVAFYCRCGFARVGRHRTACHYQHHWAMDSIKASSGNSFQNSLSKILDANDCVTILYLSILIYYCIG